MPPGARQTQLFSSQHQQYDADGTNGNADELNVANAHFENNESNEYGENGCGAIEHASQS
jgi:hypothetical protein